MRILFLLLATTFAAQLSGQIIPLNDTLRSPALQSWELTEARWEQARSYAGRYSVETPGTFVEALDSVETAVGPLVYHTHFFQPTAAFAENVLYMISYCDYPEGALHSDSTELVQELFAATEEAAATSVGGELLYSSDIELAGYPGRIWRIDYRNGQATVRTRAFVVGHRYYAVQAVSRGELRLNSSSDRFLDSFRVFAAEKTE